MMKNSMRLWILGGILLLLNVVMYATQWGGETVLTYFSNILAIVFALLATFCLFMAVRSFKENDFTKKAWTVLFAGILIYSVAELIYAILELGYQLDMNEAFPTLADYFWTIAYIPVVGGLLMMLSGYKKSGFPMGNPSIYITISAAALFMAVLIIYYMLIPIIIDTETSIWAKFFYLFYPIGDVIVVIPAVILMYITSLFGKGILSRPWKYLAIGFICFTVADLLFAYLDWSGLYGSGNFIDLLFNAGYLFIGLAGLYQKELIESFKGE